MGASLCTDHRLDPRAQARARRALSASLALACGLFGGCTATVEPARAEALEGGSGSLGILQVERIAADGDGKAPATAQLGAAFARYRGVSGNSVVRLLGGRGDSPRDACVLDGAGGEALLASDAAQVELLDVGPIDVRIGNAAARLVPRAFPELARVAAGFFYAGDATGLSPRPDVDEVSFHAEGSAELPGFDVAVPAPAELAEVRVDGVAAGDGVVLRRQRDVEVTWEAGDPRDVVEIEIVSAGRALVCRATDDGAMRVGATQLALVREDSAAQLVVRRVRVQPFDATGVDVAYVRLATARVYDADLR
jgi:hypothetical protein